MATLGGTAAATALAPPSCGARSGAGGTGGGGRRMERQLSGSVAASSGKGMGVGCSPRAGSRRCARAVWRARPCDRDVKLRAASGDGVRDGDAEMDGEAPEREAIQSGRGSPGARGRKNGAGGSSPSSALVASNSLASLPGVAGADLTGALLRATGNDWCAVFLVAAGMHAFGALVFLCFGRATDQRYGERGAAAAVGAATSSALAVAPADEGRAKPLLGEG